MKPKIFLSHQLFQPILDRLTAESDFTRNPGNGKLTPEELIAGAKECDGILVTGGDHITGEFLDACPTLRIVANNGVGFDHINVPAATERGIIITNTPDVLTEATADIAFGLLIAAARRFTEAEAHARSGNWKGFAPFFQLGAEIYGTTLGIIGLGRIGQAVARRAQGFGMKVIYWNRTRLSTDQEKELQVEYRSREDLTQESDFISLHVPSTPETHHLIDESAFSKMKPTAIFINTARGNVVDEKALAQALHNKTIAGAGLDVFEHEPKIEPALLSAPNCTILPHIGSATLQTRTRMGMLAAENLLTFFSGQRPPTCLNPEVLKK